MILFLLLKELCSSSISDAKSFNIEIILFNTLAFFIHKSKIIATTAKIQITRLLVLTVVALNLGLCIKKARALNKMISKHLSFTKRRVI
jgi:hypothetical protein